MSLVGARPPVPAPGWITDLFEPGRVNGVSRLGWGFHNETWKVELADGRRLAVTRLAAAEWAAEAASSIVSLTRLVRPRLLTAGVPSPAVVDLASAAATGVMVTEFVEGTPGAELLDSEDGPALVGSLLGATWRKLSSIDPTGLPLPNAWDGRDGVAGLSESRLIRANPWLTGPERRQLAAGIGAVAELLADRQPGFVHGDLAPVNIVVRDRTLAALLDFEFVRLADPLLDAAWFEWIVAFHHPTRRPAAWRAFVTAADLDEGDLATRDLLRILPLVRLLEILDDDRLTTEQAQHWIRMLRACLERPR